MKDNKKIVEITNGLLWYGGLEGITFDVYQQDGGGFIVASDWDNYNGTYRIIRSADCRIVEKHGQLNELALLRSQVAALEAELTRRDPDTCEWRYDGDYLWESTCGLAFFFEEGNTEDNDFNYCPKCGRRLEDTTGSEIEI